MSIASDMPVESVDKAIVLLAPIVAPVSEKGGIYRVSDKHNSS
jgi:hypothetical protein